MTLRAHELTGEAGAAHRAWALAERAQTECLLYEFLVSRMSREKSVAVMDAIPYPALPPGQE